MKLTIKLSEANREQIIREWAGRTFPTFAVESVELPSRYSSRDEAEVELTDTTDAPVEPAPVIE